jgi:flagellar biosynthesis/type III secretory pathway chaperone
MDSLSVELAQALEQQRDILKEMLAAARDHNQALRQNALVALKEAIEREEEINVRFKACDRQRELLQNTLVEKLNVPAATSLGKLLPCLPEKHSALLSGLVNEIKSIAGEIAGVADLNKVLTRTAMQFNAQLLKLLTPVHNSTYQHDGNSAIPAERPSSLINITI